ncbi:hypothetical protein [Opacimonas viscosa]|uniref:Uncharacterized protein n=1 Tax=Opacimonas viscosa TaxID=2961944 RepID=A0AA42BLZ9_9ALTE|nr:hypothetical protein [Opacimonas viscosa]MCP3429310.1 hypothetical protein [Opacimonas viscosa]
MKNLIIAILMVILLVNGLLHVVYEWFDFTLMLNSFNLDIVSASILFSALSIIAVIIGFVVAVSVLGTVVFVGFAILSSVFIVSMTAFWPALLIMLLAIWLLSNKVNKDLGDNVTTF